MITHGRYLELYHEGSEAVRREMNLLLGRGDVDEAKLTLERWDAAVDALWAQVQTPA